MAAERELATFADRVPASVVRPPIVFGPGDHASLQMFRGMKAFPVHPTPGFRRWPVSLVYVEDLCRALIDVALRGERLASSGEGGGKPQATGEAAAAPPGQGVYYVAAQRHVTYGEFGRLAAGFRCLALRLSRCRPSPTRKKIKKFA